MITLIYERLYKFHYNIIFQTMLTFLLILNNINIKAKGISSLTIGQYPNLIQNFTGLFAINCWKPDLCLDFTSHLSTATFWKGWQNVWHCKLKFCKNDPIFPSLSRSSHPEVSVKQVLLEILQNSQENTCARDLQLY